MNNRARTISSHRSFHRSIRIQRLEDNGGCSSVGRATILESVVLSWLAVEFELDAGDRTRTTDGRDSRSEFRIESTSTSTTTTDRSTDRP